MNSLPLFQIESDLLDTAEVATNYGIGARAITQHFSRNQDELIEGVHYHLEINPKFKTKIIKWTLEGVYMLGFFVKKSKVAKEYRSKVAKAIAQAREKQLANAKETKARNVELAHKYADLEAYAKSEAKHHGEQIKGYKGQLAQHNAVIADLRNQLKAYEFKAEPLSEVETLKQKLSNAEAMAKEFRLEMNYFAQKYRDLKLEIKLNPKGENIANGVLYALNGLDKVYEILGILRAYAIEDNKFNKEKLERIAR